jgi:hypothetical protein
MAVIDEFHVALSAQAIIEHLCRYVSRSPVAESRLSLTSNGDVRYDVNGITNVAGAWMPRSDPAEDTVSRRHYPRDLSAAGFSGAPCSAGAAPAREPDQVFRGIRAK